MTDAELIEDLMAREQRLIAAYEAALRREAIEPALGALLLEQEREHVRGLEQALRAVGGGEPQASVPSPELTSALRDPRAFAEYALLLEGETAGAYAEAAARIARTQLRQPLGSIMACEAAHEVALRESAGFRLIVPQR